MAVQISHVGLCVSDLERSLRFYVDGLGFEVQETIPCGDEVGPLGEVESPVEMVAQFIAKDGTRVELLAWPMPGVVGEPSRRRNQIGLTHLAMQVDDIEEVADFWCRSAGPFSRTPGVRSTASNCSSWRIPTERVSS